MGEHFSGMFLFSEKQTHCLYFKNKNKKTLKPLLNFKNPKTFVKLFIGWVNMVYNLLDTKGVYQVDWDSDCETFLAISGLILFHGSFVL